MHWGGSSCEGLRWITMRVLMVIPRYLPFPRGVCGVPVVTWSLVKSLLDRGHTATVCTFQGSDRDRHRGEALRFLASLGVGVHDLDEGASVRRIGSPMRQRLALLRRGLIPRLADFYPGVRHGAALQGLIRRERPDVLYAFDFSAAASLSLLDDLPPLLTAVVNLDHVVHEVDQGGEAKGAKAIVRRALDRAARRRLPAWEVRVLLPSRRVVAHAAHHGAWLRKKGVADCLYLPNPVVDAIGPGCHRLRGQIQASKSKPVILFVGRLDSTINRPALAMLAREILPVLEEELGKEGFELHIVGQGDLREDVAHRLRRPSVLFKGYVEDIKPEFLGCHVLIVPTPSELGFRTRVAEGFSYGCCVVSHSSNALGMPELVHEDNALLAASGRELALEVVRAVRDRELRGRLEKRARETYEERLEAGKVAGRIVSEMEAIVGGKKG